MNMFITNYVLNEMQKTNEIQEWMPAKYFLNASKHTFDPNKEKSSFEFEIF